MARLTSNERNKLPASDFAGPGRTFPVEDRAHAIAAERLAGRSEKAGNITRVQKSQIVAKAQHELNHRLGVLPRKHSGRGR